MKLETLPKWNSTISWEVSSHNILLQDLGLQDLIHNWHIKVSMWEEPFDWVILVTNMKNNNKKRSGGQFLKFNFYQINSLFSGLSNIQLLNFWRKYKNNFYVSINSNSSKCCIYSQMSAYIVKYLRFYVNILTWKWTNFYDRNYVFQQYWTLQNGVVVVGKNHRRKCYGQKHLHLSQDLLS